jgi:hypothetical protein
MFYKFLNQPLELGLDKSAGTKALRLSYKSTIRTCTATYYAYPNFQNKNIKPPSHVNIKFVVPS